MAEYRQQRPIVEETNVRPFRTPGQKRQRVILAATVAIVVLAAGGAYTLMIPRDRTYHLATWDLGEVKRGNLVQKIQASGTVIIPIQMTLTAPDPGEYGYVDRLLVGEGEAVEKGQVLATLSVPDLEEELFDLEAELDEARRGLEQLEAQNAFSARKTGREIEDLQADVAEAEAEVERQKRLRAINAARQSDLESAEKALAALRSSLLEKRIALEESQVLAALGEEGKKAGIARYETRIRRLRQNIDLATIRSSIAGEVLDIAGTLSVPGSVVTKGMSLFTIADRSSAVIELEVPEQYGSSLAAGRTVALSVGGKAMTGTIDNIGKVAVMSSDGLGATITVKVLPEPGADLLPGSTVVSELVLGVREGVLLLPRGPYLTTGSQRYVYVVNGKTAVRTAVTYGEIQADAVQVQSGLAEGDMVITSGYQNFMEYETIILGGKR